MDYIQLFFATSPPFIIYPNNLLTNPLSNIFSISFLLLFTIICPCKFKVSIVTICSSTNFSLILLHLLSIIRLLTCKLGNIAVVIYLK